MEKTQLQTELENTLQSGNFVALDQLARQAIEQFETDAFAYYYLGEARLGLGAPDQAEVLFSRAVDLQETNIEYWLKYAAAQEKQYAFEEAANTYLLILDRDPNNKKAIHSLGLYSMRYAEKYTDALYYFNLLLKADPNNTEILVNRAEALIGATRYDEALEALGFVLAQGFHAVAAVFKIQTLKALNRTQETYSLYEELIENSPNEFAYLYDYATELARIGEYEQAAPLFERALVSMPADAPFDPYVQSPIAETFLRVGKNAEAIAIVNGCLEVVESPDKELFMMLAEAKSNLGNFEEALADISKAAELANYDAFISGFVESAKAEVLLKMGKLEEAEAIAQRLLENPMLSDLALYIQAVALLKRGNLKAAYQTARKAITSEKAKILINKDLQDYLRKMKNNVLTKLAPEFAKNSQSPVMNKLVGKLWRFDQVRSTDGFDTATIPAEEQAQFRTYVQSFFAIFSEKEVFYNFPALDEKLIPADYYVYRVSGEKGNLCQLQMFTLDGETIANLKLRLEADGTVWADDSCNTQYKLVPQNPLTVSPKMQAAFWRYFNKTQVDEASAAIKPAIQAILEA